MGVVVGIVSAFMALLIVLYILVDAWLGGPERRESLRRNRHGDRW